MSDNDNSPKTETRSYAAETTNFGESLHIVQKSQQFPVNSTPADVRLAQRGGNPFQTVNPAPKPVSQDNSNSDKSVQR